MQIVITCIGKPQYMEVVDNKTMVNVWVVDKRYVYCRYCGALSVNKSSHVTSDEEG